MPFLAKKLLAALLLPPAGPLLLAALGLFLLRRWPRLGRALAWTGVVSLWLFSSAFVTGPLLRAVADVPPLDPADARRAQAIVVLGGGTYFAAPEYGGDTVSRFGLERLRYGARLARETALPLLVTGGAPLGGVPEGRSMGEALERDFGIKAHWIEEEAADTRENALHSAPLLRAAGVQRVLLVTHAWHMPRALAEFAAAGVAAIPAPTAYPTPGPFSLLGLLPSPAGLQDGYYALHELLGRLAARLRDR